jgi:hypothetical protein
LVERSAGEELFDGQLADGDDQFGLEDFDFFFQPPSAVCDFVPRRHTVAAGFLFAGKAAADSGHVDARTEFSFGKAARFFEPAEEGFACGPSERAAEHRFFVSRCLANKKDFAQDWTAADDWLVHGRAEPALQELIDMQTQQFLLSGCRFSGSGGAGVFVI